MIRCVDCRVEFDPADSLMGSEGQCQDCWESECDRSWWRYMKVLDEHDGRIFRGEIPLEVRADIAAFLHAARVPPRSSYGIHGAITRGYGALDECGFWEYPLPDGEAVEL
jgi:hypothetical protein